MCKNILPSAYMNIANILYISEISIDMNRECTHFARSISIVSLKPVEVLDCSIGSVGD